ncbi:hypothetical protein O181_064571 [Austropuccinia psidii MF-1]|uniref:Uncharacterized protein n=1 Tax=Austropuccinia psidii MF-1 TaxID=1389203 RepID=A0A9Q3ETY2_9BASI|nr:hypothetical protein [Austropuccinia psidii MF-1]
MDFVLFGYVTVLGPIFSSESFNSGLPGVSHWCSLFDGAQYDLPQKVDVFDTSLGPRAPVGPGLAALRKAKKDARSYHGSVQAHQTSPRKALLQIQNFEIKGSKPKITKDTSFAFVFAKPIPSAVGLPEKCGGIIVCNKLDVLGGLSPITGLLPKIPL